MQNNPHIHHRQRMKERFIAGGSEQFAPHELIEMLLFYGKPQGNTNPCAHELMERFGGIKGILEASIPELMTVHGIGEHTAILIKLIAEILRRYSMELRVPIKCYDTLSKLGTYLRSKFIAQPNERLYMMVLNNRMNLLDCVLLSEGTVNNSGVPLRRMQECIFAKKGVNIVLAHNHPDGLAIPSRADFDITDTIYTHFSALDINLVEHLIFTDERFYPIMQKHNGMFRRSPYGTHIDSSFYQNFYDLDTDNYTFPPLMEDIDPLEEGAKQLLEE